MNFHNSPDRHDLETKIYGFIGSETSPQKKKSSFSMLLIWYCDSI